MYVVIATTPVHRLQIRPTLHNYRAPHHSPKLHPGPSSSMGMRRQTDRQTNTKTAVATIYFASATPHAKITSCRDVKEWSQNDACRSPMHGPEPDDGAVAVATTIMRTRCTAGIGRTIADC